MNVLAYGTLMFPEVMEALTGKQFPSEAYELKGFVRRRLIGQLYPGLIEKVGETVCCSLYFDIDPASLQILDQAEDQCYERRMMEVVSVSRGALSARVYVIPLTRARLLSEERWDHEAFRERHLTEYVMLCKQHRQSLGSQ